MIMLAKDTYNFSQGEKQEAAFFKAFTQNRLHHAWLLCGQSGLGKATFAFRAARFLLGRDRDKDFGILGVSPEDADAKLIAAQSHPDLLVIDRFSGEGTKSRKSISVDAIRDVGAFFALAPSRSPYRVCIIDSVDELNINSANALLKILEEPPQRGILFLVCHAPGRLLATIKSRCRRLGFTPWNDQNVAHFLQIHSEIEPEKKDIITRLAKGSPGAALRFSQSQILELASLADDLIARKSLSEKEKIRLSVLFKTQNAKNDGAELWAQFLFCLRDRLQEKALSAVDLKSSQHYAELWQELVELETKSENINLDRGEIFFQIYNKISKII